jgi:hypothetical protein
MKLPKRAGLGFRAPPHAASANRQDHVIRGDRHYLRDQRRKFDDNMSLAAAFNAMCDYGLTKN